MTQTLDQKRAAHAWAWMNNVADKESFATTCKQTAARILNAGLGGALAFSIAKSAKDTSHGAVAKALTSYLAKLPMQQQPRGNPPDPKEYLGCLIAGDAMTLRHHTDEALALLIWLARLAEGMAKSGGGKG